MAEKQLIKQPQDKCVYFNITCSLHHTVHSPQGKLSHPRTNRGNLKISALKQEAVCRASINYQKNFTALAWATASFDSKTEDWFTVNCCNYFLKSLQLADLQKKHCLFNAAIRSSKILFSSEGHTLASQETVVF